MYDRRCCRSWIGTIEMPGKTIANIIEIRHNKPMVSSLKIAELFERRHADVLRTIRKELADELAGRKLAFGSYLDKQNQQRPLCYLNEEQALFVMPFIGGRKSREGQRALVKAYLYYRDHYADPPRAELLAAKRAAHHPMMDALIEFREEQGKVTETRNFMVENKLCNWIVIGEFRSIDESLLSNADAKLLKQVRRRNESYLIAGLEYKERRQKLSSFAIRARTKLITENG